MRWLIGALVLVWLGGAAAAQELQLEGNFVQGGLVKGKLPPGSTVVLDGRELRVDAQGRFVLGFGRDAARAAVLEVRYPDGRRERRDLEVAAREFEIQRIDGLPPRQVTPSREDLERIRSDGRLITAARARDTGEAGFAQPIVWPATGPVTGIFGSQRILNGEPRSPHKGVDLAAPAGTPVRAMASGTISLAEPDMYFTGGTVMIDHGHGLHSIYSHLARVEVAVGDRLEQGEILGTVGATGRATGPHLHWGVYWFQEAVDPALLVGAMPQG